jgi:hypothetical protein
MIKKLLILLMFSSNLHAQTFTTTAYIDQEISCHGNKDGYISIVAYHSTSSTSEFTYSLSNNDSTIYNNHGMFLNLPKGVYTVCAILNTESQCHVFTLVEPDSIIIKPNTEDLVTCGMNDGAISLEITGGTTDLQPYVVTWKGSNGNIINNSTDYFSTYQDNLSYDTYTIKVEDDRGCFAEKSYTILKRGDINGDGNVDLLDVAAIDQLMNIHAYYYRADLVKDYIIDLQDVGELESIVGDFNCN